MHALGATASATVLADANAVAEFEAALQTRREIRSELDTWNQYAQQGGDIANVVRRGDAEEIVRAGLVKYAQDQGWPVTGDVQRDVDNIARGFGEEALRSQGVNVSLRFKSLEGAAVNMCSAGVTYATGVNPELARMSVESFADGRLSSEEMEATCALAGSIAGAAVGQMFGLPAPIGAWVGGLIGGEIGGVVADIFGLGSDAEEELKKQRRLERQRLERMRVEATQACSEARVGYWRAFDQTLVSVEKQWQQLECQVGKRFDIRWFGQAPGAGTLFRSNPGVTQAVYRDGGYQCAHVYGCPYPPVGAQGANKLERVARAFAGRSFRWPQCTERRACDLLKWHEVSGETDALRSSRIQQYQQYLIRNAQGTEQPAYWGSAYQSYVYSHLRRPGGPPSRLLNLDKMMTGIMNDLVMTAGAVRAELDVTARRNQLRKEGLAKQDQDARAALRARAQRTKLLNYGALAVGVGALGYVVYRRRS